VEKMIIEQMTMTVASGKKQELGSALASMVGPTEVQPGCLCCRLFRSWPGHDVFRIESHWANKEDLVRYLQSSNYKKLLLLMELSTAPPELEFYTVLEVRGLDLVEAARETQE
jgi:quinol monooxygenase YgiN